MKKVNLTNAQYLQLDIELNGLVNQSTAEVVSKGLLQETIPVKVRFWASRVNSKIEGIKKAVETTREELIKKYGEENDGVVSIPQTIKEGKKDIANPKLREFLDELNSVLNSEEEIEIPELSIDDLSELNTDINLNIFFKLFD
jgi:ribosomal protein S19E (S16A)